MSVNWEKMRDGVVSCGSVDEVMELLKMCGRNDGLDFVKGCVRQTAAQRMLRAEREKKNAELRARVLELEKENAKLAKMK